MWELMENPTLPRIVEDEVRLNRPVKVRGVGPLLIKVIDDDAPGSVSVALAGVKVPINPKPGVTEVTPASPVRVRF